MSSVIKKRRVVSAIACALNLGVLPVSMAANNIDISSSTTQLITADGAGNFTSNNDSANLNLGDITAAWLSNFSVNVATTTSGANTEPGNISLNTALDFNGYMSSSLTLNALGSININAGILDSDATVGDRLSLNLTPAGVVNLNSSIGESTNTTINGNLVVGATGAYNLVNASDSLTVNSITNTAGGTFQYSAGSLTLNNALNIDNTGLLGASLALGSGQNLQSAGMSVGTSAMSSGDVTQTGGSNTVNGVLTLDSGGGYTLDGGTLRTGSIDNSAGGAFTFNSGSLALTGSDFTVGSTGLLGSNVTLESSRALTNVSGNVTVDSGATLVVAGGGASPGTMAYVPGSDGTNIGGDLNNAGTTLFRGDIGPHNVRIAGAINNDGANAKVTITDFNAHATRIGGTPLVDVRSGIVNSNGANLTLDGGFLTTTSISNVSGGSFTYKAGALFLDSLIIGTGQLLGNNFTIDGSKALGTPDSALVIDAGANLVLDGGELFVDSINNAGAFSFNSGRLVLNSTSGLTVGASGVFGNNLTLGANQELSLQYGSLLVDAGSTVNLNGGTLQIDAIDNSVTGIQNNGTFNFNSGVLRLGSSFTVGSAGLLGTSVGLATGQALLTAKTVNIDAGSDLTLNGGILRADAGINNNGSFVFNSGRLDVGSGLVVGSAGLLGNNVALSANRELSASSGVTVDAGAAVSQSGGASGLYGGLTNNGSINVTGGDLRTSNVTNNSNVSIASGATFGNGNITYKPTSYTYTQDAGRTTVNGTMSVGSVVINDGRLNGSGVINGDLTMLGGVLAPGSSLGALEVTGDYVLTDAGTVQLKIGVDSQNPAGYLWDQLIVGGSYDLQGGLVTISLLDGIGITDLESGFGIGDFFRNGTKGSDTAFDPLQLAAFTGIGLYAYDVSLDSWYSLLLDGSGGFVATAAASPVPVPAAAWLFGSGLMGLLGLARRKY